MNKTHNDKLIMCCAPRCGKPATRECTPGPTTHPAEGWSYGCAEHAEELTDEGGTHYPIEESLLSGEVVPE
jgi:hypothetical protein